MLCRDGFTFHAVLASSLFCICSIFLCGWYHFQFIKSCLVWEGLQIKVLDGVEGDIPSFHLPSLCISLDSYTAECNSKHDFVSEHLIYSLGPLCSPLRLCMCVCMCVFLLESSLFCQRNSTQTSFFISSPPTYSAETSRSSACLQCDNKQGMFIQYFMKNHLTFIEIFQSKSKLWYVWLKDVKCCP